MFGFNFSFPSAVTIYFRKQHYRRGVSEYNVLRVKSVIPPGCVFLFKTNQISLILKSADGAKIGKETII